MPDTSKSTSTRTTAPPPPQPADGSLSDSDLRAIARLVARLNSGGFTKSRSSNPADQLALDGLRPEVRIQQGAIRTDENGEYRFYPQAPT